MAHDLFVGRHAELDVVGRAIAEAPAFVLVVGEAGIGKSRLIAEALARSAAGAEVLRGEALEHDQRPFELWRPVGRALDVAPPDPGLPAAERRWELVEQLAEALRSAGPTVVVLEDLHWADDVDLWVLERLVREVRDVRVAVVATSRPDPSAGGRLGPVRRLATTLELGGLDAEDIDALAQQAGPGAPALDAQALRERTGGNALFVRELLAAGAGPGLPTAVSDLLQRSLDRLEPDVQDVVLAVAAAGAATPPAVLAAALDVAPLVLEERLARAVAAGALRLVPGRRPEPHHALLAEAALARATPTERCQLHQRLADAWTATFPSPVGRAEAAGHRLAAVPLVDAASAASAVVAAAEGLRATGDLRRVVGLARAALDALEPADPGTRLPRLRLATLLGAALDDLGEAPAARDAYASAGSLLEPDDDPSVAGDAVLGMAQWVNPFQPHIELLQRLRAAETALPPGDSALRVGLLARAAVLQCSSPGGPAASRAEGDEAVAVARRLGDPGLLVQALVDRHLVPITPQEWDERGQAGLEVAARADRAGRPDLALLGYELVFGDCIDRADRNGAEDALARIEAYAQLLPSPRWRWTALVRRCELLAVAGERDELVATIDAAAEAGDGVGDTLEVHGIQLGLRATSVVLWRIPDPVLAALHGPMRDASAHLLAPFIQLMVALDEWALGDLEPVRATVERLAPRPDRVLREMQGLFGLALLGAMAAEVGAVEHARGLRAALDPFAHRLGFHALPMAASLGRLALLEGDVDAALAHHERAVAQAAALRSPTLLAWAEHHRAAALEAAGDHRGAAAAGQRAADAAGRCGVVLPTAAAPAPTTTAGRGAAMRRLGAGWEVRSPHGTAVVAHSAGLQQLAVVLAAGGAEVPATTLAGLDAAPVAADADLGPLLDATAKRQYRARISELRADIDQAEADHDPDRATLAQLELDALLRELSAAVGLGGRDRPTGSAAEKARVNVTRSLRRAIAAVGAEVPSLGEHLDRSVRTGRHCTYAPEPTTALTWDISQ